MVIERERKWRSFETADEFQGEFLVFCVFLCYGILYVQRRVETDGDAMSVCRKLFRKTFSKHLSFSRSFLLN